MTAPVGNFVVLDSVYGHFIVARTCAFQAEALVKTGRTHIEDELRNIFAVVDTLPPGAVILDGGANIGFFTIPVAQRVRDRGIRVIALEPQRQLYQALCGSVVLNGLEQVYVHNRALADQPGEAQLPALDYSVAQDFGMVRLQTPDPQAPVEHACMRDQRVDVVTIDSMDLPRLDFLKLDVEGHEVPAIQGGLQTITRHRPWIWVEYMITGVDPIVTSLQQVPDYVFYVMDYQNLLCMPREQASRVRVAGTDPVVVPGGHKG